MIGNQLFPVIQAVSRSDRYSMNLMAWVKKHRKLPLFVAYSPISHIDGSDLGAFRIGKTCAANLYIGYGDIDDGFLFGSRLSEILCEGSKAQQWAHPPSRRFQVLPHWWEGYIAGGKCHIDPEHVLYMDHERWCVSEDGNSRKCAWCGTHTQHRHTIKVEKTVWLPQ